MRPAILLTLFAACLHAQNWVKHTVVEGFRTNTATAADFTGDGRADVIANEGPTKQDVLFVAPDWKRIVINKGRNAIHSLALDMDGDGDLDFVAAEYSPATLYWLERPAKPLTETWREHVIDSTAKDGVNGIHGLAVADINGDKRMDLIANSAQPSGTFPNSVVWYEAPKWTRHVAAKNDAPGLSHYIGTADVNGDGRIDIATGAKVPEGGNWFAWWEQPAGAGQNWRKHVIAESQEGASNILVTDVNGDKRPDFLASRGHGKGVLWYRGPDWQAHDIDTAIEYPHSLAVGDLNGDRKPDAVACSAVYSRRPEHPVLAWYANDGKGNFRKEVISGDQASYHVTLFDMDSDGDLDIVVAGQESRNVVWYENRLGGS